jgi:hypothetical protein
LRLDGLEGDPVYSRCPIVPFGHLIRSAQGLHLADVEFGAGFRIVPAVDSDDTFLDVYLYDTLSGGAGYADLAGRHLAEILDGVQALLEGARRTATARASPVFATTTISTFEIGSTGALPRNCFDMPGSARSQPKTR